MNAGRSVVLRPSTEVTPLPSVVVIVPGRPFPAASHEFVADNPLGLPNFTRIVVHGETLPFEYLRLTIDPRDPSLFSWERVAVARS